MERVLGVYSFLCFDVKKNKLFSGLVLFAVLVAFVGVTEGEAVRWLFTYAWVQFNMHWLWGGGSIIVPTRATGEGHARVQG